MRISDWSSDVCSSDLPVDGEAEIEAVLRHRFPTIVHLPALRRAPGDRLEYLVEIKLARLGKAQRFRQALPHPGNGDLIDPFLCLPRARFADMDDPSNIILHHQSRCPPRSTRHTPHNTHGT